MSNEMIPWSQVDQLPLDEAKSVCGLIAASDLAGPHKGKPSNVLMCALVARQLGMPLMPVLQNVAIINNRPSIWGDLAMALARRHPACVDIHEEIVGEGDAMAAVCVVVRTNSLGERVEVKRRFTVQDAKLANLWDNKGPWKQYPKRMLQMRARAFAIRDALPDALLGLAIAEEQVDAGPQQATVVEAGGSRSKAVLEAMRPKKPEPEPIAADWEHSPEPADMPPEQDMFATEEVDAVDLMAQALKSCETMRDLRGLSQGWRALSKKQRDELQPLMDQVSADLKARENEGEGG